MEGEVGVQNNAPFAIVRTTDMPNIQQEDSLAISGKHILSLRFNRTVKGLLIKDCAKYCDNRKVRVKWQL